LGQVAFAGQVFQAHDMKIGIVFCQIFNKQTCLSIIIAVVLTIKNCMDCTNILHFQLLVNYKFLPLFL